MKKCNTCGLEKPLEDYAYIKQSGKPGHMSKCKRCRYDLSARRTAEKRRLDPEYDKQFKVNQRKAYAKHYDPLKQRARKYKIDYDDLLKLIETQKGLCAISDHPLDDKFHLDHCHETGQVRGLLCSNCNLGLGQFRDDLNKLQNAISYLEQHAND